MATLENFDSYSDGDLNGQGGWTADTAIDVNSTQAQSGSKSVTRAGSGGLTSPTKSITALTVQETEFSFYVRATVVNDGGGGSFGVGIDDGTTEICRLVLSQDNNDIRLVGATTTSLGAVSTNTWYKLTIQVDFTNDRVRAKIDAGAYSAYVNGAGGAFDSIDRYKLVFGGTTGNVYIDTIEYTEPASAVFATKKLLMGVGK